jgi:four helix bundle protein
MDFRDLTVYKKAFALAMDIFEVSKSFPPEEKFSLTDQIRRCSRSVNSSIAEGYRKRQYEKHFVSKMSDGDSENSETIVWLDFALACKYINQDTYSRLLQQTEEVGKLLFHAIKFPEKYTNLK